MMNLKKFWDNHRFAVILVVFGLILTILLITIGFWKTLLLFGIVGLCLLVGILLDRGGIDEVKRFFSEPFKKKD